MGLLDGKVALISGAARGQGRSHAVTLAREGAAVIAFDLCESIPTCPIELSGPEDLAETERQVVEAGGQILTAVADARNTDQVEAVVAQGLERFGRIDIVLANAGIACVGPVLSITDEAWDDVVDVNLTGVFKTIRAALPSLVRQGQGGSIVVTASTAGVVPYPNQLAYVASKFGTVGMVKALALELAVNGIRVNALAPSTVRSDMSVNPVFFELFSGRPDASEDEVQPHYAALNAVPRPWVEQQEVSDAVLWLCSDATRSVTGTVIPVDLGFSIHGPFDLEAAALPETP